MMEEKVNLYKCKRCDWKGTEKDLDSELVDTCLGDEPVYICPRCGSYEVEKVKPEVDNN